MAYVCGYRPEHVGYAFMDLDGNGVKELIIGDTEYGIDGVIYALYSYADGSIKEVFRVGSAIATAFVTVALFLMIGQIVLGIMAAHITGFQEQHYL